MAGKQGTSKCRVCGKMCEEEFIPQVEGGYLWTHSNNENSHPPYPALEWSKDEALKDLEELKKESPLVY